METYPLWSEFHSRLRAYISATADYICRWKRGGQTRASFFCPSLSPVTAESPAKSTVQTITKGSSANTVMAADNRRLGRHPVRWLTREAADRHLAWGMRSLTIMRNILHYRIISYTSVNSKPRIYRSALNRNFQPIYVKSEIDDDATALLWRPYHSNILRK